MKKTLIHMTAVASLIPVFFVAAMAAVPTVNAQSACTPSAADFAALRAIQANPALTQADELNQELALRRQLLAETIACATGDAQSLQAVLAAGAPSSGGANSAVAASIKSQLAGKLDDAIIFYNIEAAKVNGAGISATEIIAKDIIAWRATNYAPLEGAVNNFALWAENQSLFTTAQNRLAQTARVVAFIESAAATNGNIETALQAAQSAFTDAQNENISAGMALAQAQPSDATLALIQQSLQSLADTYQKFTGLNGLIQAVLPTSN